MSARSRRCSRLHQGHRWGCRYITCGSKAGLQYGYLIIFSPQRPLSLRLETGSFTAVGLQRKTTCDVSVGLSSSLWCLNIKDQLLRGSYLPVTGSGFRPASTFRPPVLRLCQDTSHPVPKSCHFRDRVVEMPLQKARKSASPRSIVLTHAQRRRQKPKPDRGQLGESEKLLHTQNKCKSSSEFALSAPKVSAPYPRDFRLTGRWASISTSVCLFVCDTSVLFFNGMQRDALPVAAFLPYY